MWQLTGLSQVASFGIYPMVSVIVADVGAISEAPSLLCLVPVLGKSKELGVGKVGIPGHLCLCMASRYGLSNMVPTGSQIC